MSDILNEQLSALVDGELPPEETALLLKRLEREPELARRLAGYRICGEVLRGETCQPRADFAVRISAAIAREPPGQSRPAARAVRRVPGWFRSAGGLAVAASVGVLAVLILQRGLPVAPRPAEAILASEPATVTPSANERRPLSRAPGGEPQSYVTPAVRPGLQEIQGATLANYVVAHSEVSGPLAGRSVLIHLLADQPTAASPAGR